MIQGNLEGWEVVKYEGTLMAPDPVYVSGAEDCRVAGTEECRVIGDAMQEVGTEQQGLAGCQLGSGLTLLCYVVLDDLQQTALSAPVDLQVALADLQVALADLQVALVDLQVALVDLWQCPAL